MNTVVNNNLKLEYKVLVIWTYDSFMMLLFSFLKFERSSWWLVWILWLAQNGLYTFGLLIVSKCQSLCAVSVFISQSKAQ